MAQTAHSPPPRRWWNPGAHARRRPRLLQRQAIVGAVRAFFAARDFVEVETPALQVSPGLEPHLMAFATEFVAPDERRSRLYLHTSPEFAMKKLLAAGEERLFQIARVFRNGERSDTHHPEFAMLEWYRAGADYGALMEDCEGLLRAAAEAAGAGTLGWKGRAADPRLKAERLSVADAFTRYAGIDILATAPVAAAPDAALLAREAKRIGVRVAEGDEWDDIFFRVFLERIEPRLGHPAATILFDYPISMAALSRPKASDPRLAERFELYVAGLELANAFSELTDADEQRQRFAAWQRTKEARYGLAYPVDEDFLAALSAMPSCAGIALGIDRLVMLATGAPRIEDVLWAPVAEGGS
jgi:elongation factor P--(R)-beta-lysine ligase